MREKYTATDAQDDWELEQLFRKLGGERASKAIARRKKSKPLGRPEDNHISLLVEMVQIIQRDGYDFGNKQAQSKAAREVAKKRPKGRTDVTKTLIKKVNAALERARVISLWEGKKLFITIQVDRDRSAPSGHVPEGANV